MPSLPDYAHEFAAPPSGVVAGWVAHPPALGRPLTLAGPCPTCGDDIELSVPDAVVAGAGTPAAHNSSPVASRTVLVTCGCLSDHAGPAGVRGGCGRYWLARLTLSPSGTYDIAAASLGLGLLPAHAALREALDGQTRRVQATAEKWIGAVTALVGLFSLTGIATGSRALEGMKRGERAAVGVALLAALACASTSLAYGYLAAYGWPRVVPVADDAQVASWYARHLAYGPKAARRLAAAVTLALASLALTSLVTGLVWFLPR